MLASGTRVRGFQPGRSRRIFFGRKNPQHAFLRKGSKAVCPLSQICGTIKNPCDYMEVGSQGKICRPFLAWTPSLPKVTTLDQHGAPLELTGETKGTVHRRPVQYRPRCIRGYLTAKQIYLSNLRFLRPRWVTKNNFPSEGPKILGDTVHIFSPQGADLSYKMSASQNKIIYFIIMFLAEFKNARKCVPPVFVCGLQQS
jgi:hypothetical protein